MLLLLQRSDLSLEGYAGAVDKALPRGACWRQKPAVTSELTKISTIETTVGRWHRGRNLLREEPYVCDPVLGIEQDLENKEGSKPCLETIGMPVASSELLRRGMRRTLWHWVSHACPAMELVASKTKGTPLAAIGGECGERGCKLSIAVRELHDIMVHGGYGARSRGWPNRSCVFCDRLFHDIRARGFTYSRIFSADNYSLPGLRFHRR